jgi:hypothetical protein
MDGAALPKAPEPARRRRAPRVAAIAAIAAAGALLAPGCTSGEGGGPTAPSEPAPAAASASSAPPPPSPSPSGREAITFVHQRPDPPCLPAPDLTFLPSAGEHRYESLEPALFEEERGGFREHCSYKLAEIGDGEDMVRDDHVYVSLNMALFRQWRDSSWYGVYPEIPVGSDDLRDWSFGIPRPGRNVVWEGCGPATPCAGGEEPTVRTYSSQTGFYGHVGNLEIYARITYIAEHLPADVQDRITAIFRELVLAIVDSKERVE